MKYSISGEILSREAILKEVWMNHYLIYLFTADKALEKQLLPYMQQKGWLVLTFFDPDIISTLTYNPPDIWLLDTAVFGADIIRLTKRLFGFTPVLTIAPAKTKVERVIGLEQGSDDYLAKPFLPEEVVLRVERLLKRNVVVNKSCPVKACDNIIEIPPYMLNVSKRVAMYHRNEIALSSNEFELLLFLAVNRRQILTYEQILKHIWGQKRTVQKRAVYDLIYHLRNKLPQLSLTSCFGKGFKLS
jgi:two-component system response regulator CssR